MQSKVYIQLDLFDEGGSTVSRVVKTAVKKKVKIKVYKRRKIDERQECFCFGLNEKVRQLDDKIRKSKAIKQYKPRILPVKHTKKKRENHIEPNKSLSPEKNLWISVIELAMCDSLFNDRFKHKDKWKQNMMSESKSSAICWLNASNSDFITVCRLAELEPEWVLKLYNENKDNPKRFPKRLQGRKKIR